MLVTRKVLNYMHLFQYTNRYLNKYAIEQMMYLFHQDVFIVGLSRFSDASKAFFPSLFSEIP